MRSVFASFTLGYLSIALLAVPMTLWAFQATPSYVGGVTMVLDRSGLIMPIRSQVEQAVRMRDKLMDELGDYLGNKFFPSRVVAD
jgi:hypothetical protein